MPIETEPEPPRFTDASVLATTAINVPLCAIHTPKILQQQQPDKALLHTVVSVIAKVLH